MPKVRDIKKLNISANDKKRKVYNLFRVTKIRDPKSGKDFVRHGKKGQEIIMDATLKTFKTRMKNAKNNNAKTTVYNKSLNILGARKTLQLFKGTRVPTQRRPIRGPLVRSGRLANAQKIREEIGQLTNGQVTLAGRVTTLGEGAAGLAVKCKSNTTCDKKYKDLVLKVSNADDEWENEVRYLNKLTKYMKDNPKKDPLAPYIVGSFEIDNQGFILMQNAKNVYPKALKAVEWKKVGLVEDKLKLLPELKRAMERLHKEVGIMHGNMHDGNVWFAEVPVGTKGKN